MLAGKGLVFAGEMASLSGQPEIAAPLLLAGGGTLAASRGLKAVGKSKILKKK